MPRASAATRLRVRDLPFAIRFDGSGDFIDLGNNYAFERTDAFSVCGYFRASSFGTTNQSLIRKSSTAALNAQGWAVFLNTADKCLTFFLSANSTTNRISVPVADVHAYQLRNWYFWGISYDGSSDAGGVKFVLVKVGQPLTAFCTKQAPTNNALTATTVNTQVLRIGTSSDGTRAFNGLQSDIKIRTAASSIEDFQSIYYKNLDLSSLASRWIGPGTAGSGATVEDEVGSVDGTITAATWSAITPFKNRVNATSRTLATTRAVAS